MWQVVGALIVGVVVPIVAWWIKNDPKRRREQLRQKIVRLEFEVEYGLWKNDADALAVAQHDLERLRQEAGFSASS